MTLGAEICEKFVRFWIYANRLNYNLMKLNLALPDIYTAYD